MSEERINQCPLQRKRCARCSLRNSDVVVTCYGLFDDNDENGLFVAPVSKPAAATTAATTAAAATVALVVALLLPKTQ